MPFEPALLSGYVDGELTQAEVQRVRIYLEDHPEARGEVEAIERIRAAARKTTLRAPLDTQWDERPRGLASALARNLGGLAVLVTAMVLLGLGLWQLATSPLPGWLKGTFFVGLLGFGLLFLSVLIDRLRIAPNDRYRRVEK